MNNSYFKRVMQNTPTRFWINNVTREQAKISIEAGAQNCTQNPTYPWKIINNSTDSEYAKKLFDDIIRSEANDETVLRKLQCSLITNICKIFEPVYKSTAGKDGWVTIQGSPLYEDVDTILEWGRIHHKAAANLMLKIPATKDGIQAMEILLREGCAVLATEVMSVAQVIDIGELYKKISMEIENPPVMYFAHIAGIFDEHLQVTAKKENIDVDCDALWQAGIIVAKRISRLIDDRDYRMNMLSGGARGMHHFTEMVGARSGVTINWANTADKLIELDGPVIDRYSAEPSPDVVDELLEKIPDFKKAYERKGLSIEEYEAFGPVKRFRDAFEDGWLKCLKYIVKRRKELNA